MCPTRRETNTARVFDDCSFHHILFRLLSLRSPTYDAQQEGAVRLGCRRLAMFAGASLTGGGVAHTPRGPLQRPMRESNSTMTKKEAEDLARAEEEGEGQVAVRTRGTYEEKKETRGKIKKKPWYIIDPRTSKFMGYWDAISMVSYAPAIETASQQPALVPQPLLRAPGNAEQLTRGCHRAVPMPPQPTALMAGWRRRRRYTRERAIRLTCCMRVADCSLVHGHRHLCRGGVRRRVG